MFPCPSSPITEEHPFIRMYKVNRRGSIKHLGRSYYVSKRLAGTQVPVQTYYPGYLRIETAIPIHKTWLIRPVRRHPGQRRTPHA